MSKKTILFEKVSYDLKDFLANTIENFLVGSPIDQICYEKSLLLYCLDNNIKTLFYSDLSNVGLIFKINNFENYVKKLKSNKNLDRIRTSKLFNIVYFCGLNKGKDVLKIFK